ncbi:site-specific integrase [Pseudorhodobacter sp. W20_MBD10_FR17]|uniref:site-specific integrase n=1 Tax=Pseudorhodobacter sp. W20_MBD10_FR17 TaxID=3240266 RepID=UPI003F9E95E9
MGSIVERKRKDGTVSYRAQILIKSKGRIVHQESSTFDRLTTAKAWLKRREKELATPGGLDAARRKSGSVGDVIEDYLKATGGEIGRTKSQVLRKIRNDFAISDIPCDELKPSDVTSFARALAKGGAAPSTVQNYLSHLNAVLSIARTAWNYEMDRNVALDGITAARHLKLAAKSKSRTRRPTLDEIERLIIHFSETYARDSRSLPMHVVMTFAMFSSRRQDEITRITWEDFHEPDMTQLVRDMKHPGQKKGNDVMCETPPEAIRAMKLQRHRMGKIFPYNSDTVSSLEVTHKSCGKLIHPQDLVLLQKTLM